MWQLEYAQVGQCSFQSRAECGSGLPDAEAAKEFKNMKNPSAVLLRLLRHLCGFCVRLLGYG
jgi:hypothetical protein